MASRKRSWICGLLVLMLAIAPARAQTTPPGTVAAPQAIRAESDDALHDMSRLAGVIFAGRVIAIRRHAAADGATGVVEIEFAVDDAIRGVAGDTYTLREWGGLWAAGIEPYRVGERYLMLLHSPGAAGLSSPVGGSDGAIPIRGGGGPLGVDSANAAVAGVSGPATLIDLRWVATRATRAVAYGADTVAHPTSLAAGVRTNAIDSQALQVDVLARPTSDAPAAEQAAYTSVLAILRSWEKGDHVVR